MLFLVFGVVRLLEEKPARFAYVIGIPISSVGSDERITSKTL